MTLKELCPHAPTEIIPESSPLLGSEKVKFRMGRSTICGILKDTCEAIWSVLMPQYVRAPATAIEWEGVSRQFEQMWNVPHCIGKVV